MDSAGSFALVLHSHIPYVLSHGRWPHGTDWLSEAAAECYLPLLDVLNRLVLEGISPKVTLGLTPVLMEQLADPSFAAELEAYLEGRIAAVQQDAATFRREIRPEMVGLTEYWRQYYFRSLVRFRHAYDRDLVGAFRALQDAGHIEILASAATHGYLPLLGTDVAVRAQVRLGVATYERHFGRKPRGFWLPECAYRPRYGWQPPVERFRTPELVERAGIEEILAEQGLEYFYVDAHLLKGGNALGVYADRFGALEAMWERYSAEAPETAERSPYCAYRVAASPVAVFARDAETGIQVWSGQVGYPGDEWYVEFHKKHYPGNLRYWRVSWPRDDLGRKELYEPVRAMGRLGAHAEHFARLVAGVAGRHPGGIVTAMYDTELFGHWWHEGAEWLYYAIRRLEREPDVRRVTSGEYLAHEAPTEAVTLPEGSWGEGGYHWIWLNEGNAWVWEKVYQAEREMAALAAELGGDARCERILNQAARELLLLESSDWAFNISTWSARDYAEQRVRYHFGRFEALAALTRAVAAGEEISVAAWNELADCEARDRCFPDVDARWWGSLGQDRQD